MGDDNSSSITISNSRSRKGKKPSKGQENEGNSKGLLGGLMAMAGPPGNILVVLGVGIAAGLFLLSRSRKKKISQDFGAFIQRLEILPPPQPAPPIAPHPLSNLTFAVKDIFDIEGSVTGFGNPDWQRTHGPALRTAPAVAALVHAGATCVGKTHMDEMAYSIDGENKHYGTPVNPAVPSRVPGGSSSGSAVAVAAGLVDFALGTDTAGSVRIPAAYCGILGFRPSHGVVSCIGVTPMAQSFDTVGWFARDPNVLQKVGQVLLQQSYVEAKPPTHVIIADDCFSLSDMQSKQLPIVLNSIEKTYGRQTIIRFKLGEYLLSKLPSLKNFGLDGEIVDSDIGLRVLNSLRSVLQLIQRHEFKTNHSDWINSTKPSFGPGISDRIRTALGSSSDLVEMALKVRHEARMALNELLMGEGILIIPTTPCIPPKLRSKVSASFGLRDRALTLLSIAGMSGACQATVPVGKHDGCPMAISLVAKHGADRFLLETVKSVYAVLQKEAEIIASGVGTSNKAAPRPEAAEAAKERGNVAFKKKDFRTAIDCYTEAIQCDGSNATYYSNRAAAYLAMCSFHQAEADCGKAIELDKKNVKAYLRRGTAREFLGYYKEADEDFRQALVLEPTNKTAGEGVKRLKKLLYE